MAFLIIIFFVLSCFLAYIEDRLPKKYQYMIFLVFGFCLILMCGLKEIGLDPDSENYADSYRNYYSDKVTESVELSFVIISAVLNVITDDAHILFLFYALIGVTLKMFAITKFNNNHMFMLLAAYLSYYYVVQDMMQIRTGAMTGFVLLAIREIGEGKRLLATLLIIIGSCFHVSGILVLPFVFLSKKPLTWISGSVLVGMVVLSLLFSAGGVSIMNFVEFIPYAGEKLAIYEKAADIGASLSTINAFGVFHLFSIAVFLYLVVMSRAIMRKDKYFPLLIRLYAVGLMSYTLLGFIPDLGARVSHIFRIVSIMLIADMMYTIRPRWAGVLIAQAVALIYLNYELQFINFSLLWQTAQ